MAGEQENINQIAGVIDDGVNTFLEGVEKSQSGIFNKTLSIVKELETDVNGNIKQTVKNLKLLTKVRKNIVDEVLTEAYQKRVKTFTNEYPAIQSLNNGYFKGIEAAFDPNRELYNQIVQKSIQTTSASLLDSGIDQNVIEPIIRIVDDSVSTGATFTDMVDELRTVIKGDPERLGNLMRYSKQITQDALNQFNGIYNETIATDLDLEWYYYSGGKRRTSRPFCKKYAGKYFHKKEVEDFGKRKDLDGSNLCGGSSKTDLCQGRIPGTNSSSIFRYRAGYNCKHVYKPTMIDAVPKNVVNRNIKKGYYVPEGEEVTKKPVIETPIVKKPVTKQPKKESIGKFNAKTRKEAEIFVVESGIAKKSGFSSAANLGQINKAVNTANDLKNKYGLETLDFFGSGNELKKSLNIRLRGSQNASAYYVPSIKSIGINPKPLKATYTDLAKKYNADYSKWRTLKAKSAAINAEGRRDISNEVKDLFNNNVKERLWTAGDSIESIVTHELGHHLHHTKGGIKLNEILNSRKKEGWAYLVSDYAKTNSKEFFAESFSAYDRSFIDKKLINKDIRSWIDSQKK